MSETVIALAGWLLVVALLVIRIRADFVRDIRERERRDIRDERDFLRDMRCRHGDDYYNQHSYEAELKERERAYVTKYGERA